MGGGSRLRHQHSGGQKSKAEGCLGSRAGPSVAGVYGAHKMRPDRGDLPASLSNIILQTTTSVLTSNQQGINLKILLPCIWRKNEPAASQCATAM